MRPSEVKLLCQWLKDPEVNKYWYGRDKKMSVKKLKKDWKYHYFVDRWPERGRLFTIRVGKKTIGIIAYNKIDKNNRKTEIDILIGNKAYWNRGYGSDALKTFIPWLFKKFKLHKVWICARANNPRAIKTYKKIGFVQEGILRKEDFHEGKFIDAVLFSILENEYKKI